jgi:outer membrane protein TolC
MPASNISTQNPFLGSMPQAGVPGVYSLGLRDSINRGLRYNLGLLLAGQGERQARGARLNTLSSLLPNVVARVSETVEQLNLATVGIPPIPGIPQIVGPFSVFDTRGFLSQKVLDLEALYNLRARSDNLQAAKYTYADARDLVVLVVGGAYMQAVAGAARIDAVRAQVQTADAVYRQSLDMRKAGVSAGIDVLRSQVELQAQQQRLLAVQNDFEKQKLALLRAIGLPTGQAITLSDKIPFSPSPAITLDDALARAFRSRADYQSAQSLLHAAEMAKKAAAGEGLPSLQVNADYGVIGNHPANSHGTVTALAALNVPIFQGGKVRADVLQADALVQQRRSQLEDLRGRIELDVRTAFLDLKTAADQVAVAQSSIQLAAQQLAQARDRFAAGVADTIEVVQAQESVATANENFISSVFAHNLAKLSLARALGVAEEASKEFLGGK